jgi:hypothetical protein
MAHGLDATDELARARREFDAAWETPSYTRFAQPDLELNPTFAPLSGGKAQLRMTGLMLWDAELRKAWDPVKYIGDVVVSGHSWGRRKLAGGHEAFWRMSEQRAWMTGQPGTVIEQAFIDHSSRSILFLGRAATTDDRGVRLEASRAQPLFFVEHSVKGSDDAPVVSWRMVHLTTQRDEQLLARVSSILHSETRPKYVDIYLRDVLGLEIPQSEW